MLKTLIMKKIFVCLICLATVLTSSAQQLPQKMTSGLSDVELGQFYLQKSKSQKTGAWILLGVGLALQVAGSISYADNLFEESTSGADAMMLGGTIASAASFPLFISAAKNKGRAEILLRHENIPMSFLPGKQRTVGIAFSLGR
jgi:hypothetical protein